MISVVIVTFRTGPSLVECLAAVRSHPVVREILIIDNGNPPHMQTWLDAQSQADSRVRILRQKSNIGFSAACNLGGAQAIGRYIAFINPDLIVPPNVFADLLQIFDSHPGAWLCGGRLVNADGSYQKGSRREVLTPWRAFVEITRLDLLAPRHPYFKRFHQDHIPPHRPTCPVPTISGAFMMIRRCHFEALGGMDESMFLHVEDIDFCLRVLKAGGQVLYCDDIVLRHMRSTSDVSPIFVEWHKTLSTGRYFQKHFHEAYPFGFLWGIRLLLWIRFGLKCFRLIPADIKRLCAGHSVNDQDQ